MSDLNNPNDPNKNVIKNTLLDDTPSTMLRMPTEYNRKTSASASVLLHLDNKQKTPNNQKITQKFKERLDAHPSRQELEDFIKKVNDDFHLNNYGSPDVTGWNSFDILKSKTIESTDPNKFMDESIYVQYNEPRPINTRSKYLHTFDSHLFNQVMKENADEAKRVEFFRLNYNTQINFGTFSPFDNTKQNIPEKKKVNVDMEINNVADLLKMLEDYPMDDNVEYNINMKALHNIHVPLLELNNMIGMADMKNNIVDQIIYFIQDLHKSSDKTSCDFMHTVIYGPPGTGKTEVAKIMGNIFSKLGILKKGTFKKVTRSDLVAGFLGQTATKTRDVINECLDGVLFIDEAYALGNTEKRDSFSKECIDTLCEALSNHKENLMVIIAGYEEELKECFFSYNQGLDSRFTWRFKTDDYKGEELCKIFFKKVHDINWSIVDTSKINGEWFEKKIVYFKFFGRDIETLLAKTKIAHSRRIFCKLPDEKTKITLKDLEKGFELYIKNDEVKNRKESECRANSIKSMYV